VTGLTSVLGPEAPERFRQVVAHGLGLQFDDARLPFLSDVLQRRARAIGRSVEHYLGQLETDDHPEELTALAVELTVTETYFFRNIDQFHAFARVTLPDRTKARAVSKQLRFLSAGCASGEEAYSLAMLVREGIHDPSWQVTIRAVDINSAALDRAAHARFTNWALRETPAAIQRTWFRNDGRDAVLDESIRTAVEFDRRNLAIEDLDLWPADTYDAVFCRNVLMYFTPEQAQSLVGRITRSLVPGGYLFLGHAETLRGLSQQFHLCHTHGTFYYRRKEQIQAEERQPQSSLEGPASAQSLAALVEGSETWVEAISRATTRIEALTRARTPMTALATGAPSDLGPARDLLRQERFGEALELLHQLPVASSCDPDTLLLKALLLAHAGQLAAAEEVCQQLLGLDELNAGAHYAFALCREGRGDRRGAADHDQLAAYLDPLFAMPRLHMGLLARRAGDREAARRELGEAIVLLQREDPSRLLFFGGGFTRETLIALCRSELNGVGGRL